MAHDPDVAVFHVGRIPIAVLDMDGLIASLHRSFARGADAPGTYVAFCGAHGVVTSQAFPQVHKAHEEAWLTVADGRPLFWLGRLRGHRGIRQVPGIESIETVCRAGIAAGWSHYFIGGAPGVAEALATTMARLVPGLRVAGFECPPFRALAPDEIDAMRGRIRQSGAQVIWVGLGAPKQELFMAEHASHLPGTVSMGVGAAFDVNVGRIKRAPRVLQLLGLEWAHRLALEPRRLWSRYAVVVPRFIAIAVGSIFAPGTSASQPGARSAPPRQSHVLSISNKTPPGE